MAGVTSLAGRYELRRVIGRGGMGAVWAARDHAEQRDVAVKIAGPQPGAAARLRREAELTAAVTHPGVVGVRDAGEDAGTTFLVLDLLRGPDLGQVLRRGPVPAPDAVRLAAEVADALAAAHAVGVVHGDVSPANVVLAEEEAVLVDFGAACRTCAAAGRTTVGTAPYVAPEQVTAQRLGPGADVYALGCLVTASLAGRPPFTAPTTTGVLHRHVRAEPPRLRDLLRGTPAPLDEAVARMLAKDPARRGSAADAREALRAVEHDPALAGAAPVALPPPTRLDPAATQPHIALLDTAPRAA